MVAKRRLSATVSFRCWIKKIISELRAIELVRIAEVSSRGSDCS